MTSFRCVSTFSLFSWKEYPSLNHIRGQGKERPVFRFMLLRPECKLATTSLTDQIKACLVKCLTSDHRPGNQSLHLSLVERKTCLWRKFAKNKRDLSIEHNMHVFFKIAYLIWKRLLLCWLSLIHSSYLRQVCGRSGGPNWTILGYGPGANTLSKHLKYLI